MLPILNPALQKEWLDHGWLVLGGGEMRVMHQELFDDPNRLSRLIIDATSLKKRFAGVKDSGNLAKDMPPIMINGTQTNYTNPEITRLSEVVNGRNAYFGYPYTGYIIPFSYNRTVDASKKFWADLFNTTQQPVLFNRDTLVGIVITQAFYSATSDSIYSIAQLIEFYASGAVKST